jgi:hypothetical protein
MEASDTDRGSFEAPSRTPDEATRAARQERGRFANFDNEAFEATSQGFLVDYDDNGDLPQGFRARLYGFTSNQPPELRFFPSERFMGGPETTISATVAVPVPEPGTPALVVIGLTVFAWRGRRNVAGRLESSQGR